MNVRKKFFYFAQIVRISFLLTLIISPGWIYHSTAFAEGFGTLYTAIYRPRDRVMSLRWPGGSWSLSLDHPIAGARRIRYPEAA